MMRDIFVIFAIISLYIAISNCNNCDLLETHSQNILREQLRKHNCLQEVESVSPDDPVRAARLFQRDGYVVVKDALPESLRGGLKDRCVKVAENIAAKDPKGVGNRGPLRYSLGPAFPSGHLLHFPEWAQLIDLPVIHSVLKEIFGDDRYLVRGGRGDFNLPGAPYQPLHSDTWNDWLVDPSPTEWSHSGKLNHRMLPVHYIAVNYLVGDLTALNAPIRQIPLTTNSQRPIPSIEDEPLWMKRSTLCPLPAGSAIIRDARAWHGGTPNLSENLRCMPNIEYYAYWYRYHDGKQMTRSMPRDIFDGLSPFGQWLAREVVAHPGEEVDTEMMDDVTLLQADVMDCYKKLGLTDAELSNYKNNSFKLDTDQSVSFYRRNQHPDEQFDKHSKSDEL